ncbi:MAG: hypothetical protein WBB45_15510 [Cyclobacteriaceae bacterium]
MSLFLSCTNVHDNWNGGAITAEGDYYMDDLKIEVRDIKGYLKYKMIGQNKKILAQEQNPISTFQRWALHLDKSRNLWVLSSDIGDSIWQFDSISNSYKRSEIYGVLNLDSVPKDIRKTLSEFHPYSHM